MAARHGNSSASRSSLLAQARERSNRDPRAAPVIPRHNVSVRESCEFYGIADAVTQCRVPRSCADCLAKPGCMLTGEGRCMDALNLTQYYRDALWYTTGGGDVAARSDSRSPIVQLQGLSVSPVFYANNATYCAADDAVCAQCRAEFLATAATSRAARDALTRSFCVGANGCACTGVCEVPGYRATWVQDYACGTSIEYYVVGHDLPAFSSRRRDPRAPLHPQTTRRETTETCAFQGGLDVRGCQKPRLVDDCLRMPKCMVTQFDGLVACVDAQIAPSDKKDTKATVFDLDMRSSARYFPDTTAVCTASDAACSRCATDIANYSQRAGLRETEHCFGSQACLCEALVAFQNDVIVQRGESMCKQYQPNADQEIISVILIATTVVLVFLGALRYAVVQARLEALLNTANNRATRVLRHMLDNAPAGLDLDLFGWRRYHRTLRQKEERLLQGEANVSPVAGPMDLHSLWSPSAPAFEATEASTAPDRSDPMALASAPCFRGEEERDGLRSTSSLDAALSRWRPSQT